MYCPGGCLPYGLDVRTLHVQYCACTVNCMHVSGCCTFSNTKARSLCEVRVYKVSNFACISAPRNGLVMQNEMYSILFALYAS